MSAKGKHLVDIHVAKRIRQQRKLHGLTQAELAEKLSLSHQQVQKYEQSANRISAGRLYEIALVLNVPIGYFFKDLQLEYDEKEEEDLLRIMQMIRQIDPVLRDKLASLIQQMTIVK